MASIKITYGAATTFTMSATTLAAGSATDIFVGTFDSTTDGFLGLQVEMLFTTATVGTGNRVVNLFAASSLDGTNFSDSSITANARLLGSVSATANTTAYRSPAFPVEPAFGGVLPPKVKFLIQNDTSATISSISFQIRGVYAVSA